MYIIKSCIDEKSLIITGGSLHAAAPPPLAKDGDKIKIDWLLADRNCNAAYMLVIMLNQEDIFNNNNNNNYYYYYYYYYYYNLLHFCVLLDIDISIHESMTKNYSLDRNMSRTRFI
jgi:hypothetical protein